jgi:hypothetical protein
MCLVFFGFAVLTKLRVKDILFTAMVAMAQREADVLGVLRGLQCEQGYAPIIFVRGHE